jgi:N-acyl-D-aspartate/D-glutamate deacylase
MIGSDGGLEKVGVGHPHPRSYGTFTRVLGEYVRERQLLSLEEAIRKMTSLPAQTLRLVDRGLIKTGFFADVVIFNPEEVKDLATFTHPHQYSRGIISVIVNGQEVLADGQFTNRRPGQILYGQGYRPD